LAIFYLTSAFNGPAIFLADTPPMATKPAINVGDSYVAIGARQAVWRVASLLLDGMHVVLVRENEPSLRKTMSTWALLDATHFARVQPKAA
jgi:hypothetical protein